MVEDLNKQLESMRAMFGKISGGSYELKGSGDGPPSDADARMFELERQLQDARKENDKLRRQLAEMENQTSPLRYVCRAGCHVCFSQQGCKFTTSPGAEREEMCSMSQRRPEIVGGKGKCRSYIVRFQGRCSFCLPSTRQEFNCPYFAGLLQGDDFTLFEHPAKPSLARSLPKSVGNSAVRNRFWIAMYRHAIS